jgi:hypothetical protein
MQVFQWGAIGFQTEVSLGNTQTGLWVLNRVDCTTDTLHPQGRKAACKDDFKDGATCQIILWNYDDADRLMFNQNKLKIKPRRDLNRGLKRPASFRRFARKAEKSFKVLRITADTPSNASGQLLLPVCLLPRAQRKP